MKGVNAAFFLWVDLKPLFKHKQSSVGKGTASAGEVGKMGLSSLDVGSGREVENAIMETLMENKIFLGKGALFAGEEPGWFRIVFSQPREYLLEGLRRMVDALSS